MLSNGGAPACKTQQLVVLLLVCTIIATVHFCRQTRGQATSLEERPQHFVYELLGDVEHPGIYRYAERQSHAALAADCGAGILPAKNADQKISNGSRVLFTGEGTSATPMKAAVLLSYHRPITLAAATAEDLELIPGIGPKTASALIRYRERAGPVQSIAQLVEVRGIGPKTLKKLVRYLRP